MLEISRNKQVKDLAEKLSRETLSTLPKGSQEDFEAYRDAYLTASATGFVSAPLGESSGGVGLPMEDLMEVARIFARWRASFAVGMSVHWAALRSMTECGGELSISSFPAAVVIPELLFSKDIEVKGSGDSAEVSGCFTCFNYTGVSSEGFVFLPHCSFRGLVEVAEEMEMGAPFTFLMGFPRACVTKVKVEQAVVTERFEVFESFLKNVIALVGACALGCAEGALKIAIEYASQRFQTGRRIDHHQAVREKLLRCERRSRGVVSVLKLWAKNFPPLDSMVSSWVDVVEACEEVCLECVQVLGGYGYMEDYEVERFLRDIKGMETLFHFFPVTQLGGLTHFLSEVRR